MDEAVTRDRRYLVAVHVGAGYHSRHKEKAYKTLMSRACNAAATCLDNGEPLEKSVSAAISVLEDSSLTNAGHGSNLNMLGYVENDALVVTDAGLYGSVAAASGLLNPIKVATGIAIQSAGRLSLGRVAPTMIAGHGARLWASDNGIQSPMPEKDALSLHITSKSRRKHRKYLEMIRQDAHDIQSDDQSRLNDTVGCVIVDTNGDTAAGVSSGGLAMKYPGRVGEASILGAGAWASTYKEGEPVSVCCSVTGVGERIAKNLVAKHACDAASSFCKDVLSSQILDGLCKVWSQEPDPKDCGLLVAKSTKRNGIVEVDLAAAFLNSSSFGIGYVTRGGSGKTSECQMILREDGQLTRAFDIGVVWTT